MSNFLKTSLMISHLKERGLDTSLYKDIKVNDDTVIFPLWNLSGEWVGYQQYTPEGTKDKENNPLGRYYTWITKEVGKTKNTAWGIELLNPDDKTLYITEGVFKACRLHNFQLNCFAVLSSHPKHLKTWLHSLGYDIVAICDGDKAGEQLAKIANKAIFLEDGQYLDEMTDNEIKILLEGKKYVYG